MPDTSTIIAQYNTVSKEPGVVTPTEVVTDGDFVDWNLLLYPDDWGIWNAPEDAPATPGSWDQSTDSNAGTYALELICSDIDPAGGFISGFLAGFYDTAVASKTIQARFYAKNGTGTVTGIGVAAYYYDGVDDYVWNLTAGAWVVSGDVGDDGNNFEPLAITGSYAQYTSTIRTLPAGAQEFWFDIVTVAPTQYDSALLDGVEWLLAGADVASNGGFENWTEYANQEDPFEEWFFEPGNGWEFFPTEVSESDYINQTTDGGDNVVSMYVESNGDIERGYIVQGIEGDFGETLDCSAIVETSTSDSQTGYFIALDSSPGIHNQMWNFNTLSWDVAVGSVTDLPGTDNALTLSGTGSFVSNDAGDITFPVNEKIVLVFMSDDGPGTGTQYQYNFKLASAIQDIVAGGSQYKGMFASSSTDSDDIQDSDYLIQIEATGGTPSNVFSIGGDGEVNVHGGLLDFSNIDAEFADPVADEEPVTLSYWNTNRYVQSDAVDDIKSNALSVLATTAPIDMTVTGQTSLFTVPVGFTMIGYYVSWQTNTANAPGGLSNSRVGTSASGYTDVSTTVQQPSTTVGQILTNPIATTSRIAAEEEIFVDVTSGDGGTELTASMTLIGILLPTP